MCRRKRQRRRRRKRRARRTWYPPLARAPNHHSPADSPVPCSLKVLLLSSLAFIPLIVRRRPTRCTPRLPPLTLTAACFQLDQSCLLPLQFVLWCLPCSCWQPVAVDCIWAQKCALALASAALLGIPTTLADMLQHATMCASLSAGCCS